MIDRWREIIEVMWRRKLRTALTALSVAWGIFMLVVLLAAGNGLANGAETEFSRDAMNSVLGQRLAHCRRRTQGNPVGKFVRLYNEDHHAGPRDGRHRRHVERGGRHQRPRPARHADRQLQRARGVARATRLIEKTDLVDGRFINPDDQDQRRKVAVIGVKVQENLFGPATPA